jgi:hypothetical protein
MLRYSRRRLHYTPPTRAVVTKQTAAVYLAMAFLSSVSLFPESKLPIRTYIQNGFICTPLDYDLTSAIVIYCIYFPLLVGLPVTFVLLVAFDVFFYSKLLPPQGKRRVLTIYFFRMAFVFLFMWIPNAFVNYFFPRTPALLKWIIIGWSHLHGFVAAATSLLKPDIWQAVRDFLCCSSCCPESPRSTCFGTGDGGGGDNDGALSSSIPDDRDDMFTLHRQRSSRWVIWRQGDENIISGRHNSQTTHLPKNTAGTYACFFLRCGDRSSRF